MKKKQRNFLFVVVICLLGVSLFAFKGKSTVLRQPQIGSRVHPVTKQFLLQKYITEAKRTAERLDAQARNLIEASSMNFVERWKKSIDIGKLESQYSEDVSLHVVSMGEVMRLRRENGGLQKLNEFDFQNLLRKSDYLISLQLTSSRLRNIAPDALRTYKTERKFCSLKPLPPQVAARD